MKIKILIISVFTLFFTGMSNASYFMPSFEELVVNTDLIVVGEIVHLDHMNFQLKIETLVHGEHKGNIVEVQRFGDWTCSSRWRNYEVGQRVMAFMNKPNGYEPGKYMTYQLRSAGSEGEFPIIGDQVYVQGAVHSEKFEYKRSAEDEQVYGVPFEIDELVTAIKGYHRCFKIKRSHEQFISRKNVHQVCSNNKLKKYRKKSEIQDYLVKETLNNNNPWLYGI